MFLILVSFVWLKNLGRLFIDFFKDLLVINKIILFISLYFDR